MTESRGARYMAKRRREWIAAGLCRDCGCPTDAGAPGKYGKPVTGYRCAECRETARIWQAQRKKR